MQKINRYWLLITLILVNFAVAPLQAESQLHFKRSYESYRVLLDYSLSDQWGGRHHLRLPLDKQAIDRATSLFQPLDRQWLRQQAKQQRYRKTVATLEQLAMEYPSVDFDLSRSMDIRWKTSPPSFYQLQRQNMYEAMMQNEVAEIQRRFPKATISQSPQGRYRFFADSQVQLKQIEQALQQAKQRSQLALQDNDRLQQHVVESISAEVEMQLKYRIAEISQDMQNFEYAYYRQRGYRIYRHNSLIPDYAQIAQQSKQDMYPIVEYLRPWLAGLSQRQAINRLLIWVQSIPYDTLHDRANDLGFLAPINVLMQNRGDCDSKSVLMANLLHELYPSLSIAMVLLQKHALLAVDLAVQSGDSSISHLGRDWVLLEPVGPALLLVGRVGKEFQQSQQVEAVIDLF